MSSRLGFADRLKTNTLNAPRTLIIALNAVNVAASPVIINCLNRRGIGLDWAVLNNDATAGNYARVVVDGVEYQVPNQTTEGHDNEPFNVIEVYGPSTNVNIRVAGIHLNIAQLLGLI